MITRKGNMSRECGWLENNSLNASDGGGLAVAKGIFQPASPLIEIL